MKRLSGLHCVNLTFCYKEPNMGVLNEFKAFAVKGNVVDMAVGIIIGAAFGKIVSSFVGDVIMPPLGLLSAASTSATWPLP